MATFMEMDGHFNDAGSVVKLLFAWQSQKRLIDRYLDRDRLYPAPSFAF